MKFRHKTIFDESGITLHKIYLSSCTCWKKFIVDVVVSNVETSTLLFENVDVVVRNVEMSRRRDWRWVGNICGPATGFDNCKRNNKLMGWAGIEVALALLVQLSQVQISSMLNQLNGKCEIEPIYDRVKASFQLM